MRREFDAYLPSVSVRPPLRTQCGSIHSKFGMIEARDVGLCHWDNSLFSHKIKKEVGKISASFKSHDTGFDFSQGLHLMYY